MKNVGSFFKSALTTHGLGNWVRARRWFANVWLPLWLHDSNSASPGLLLHTIPVVYMYMCYVCTCICILWYVYIQDREREREIPYLQYFYIRRSISDWLGWLAQTTILIHTRRENVKMWHMYNIIDILHSGHHISDRWLLTNNTSKTWKYFSYNIIITSL